MSEDVSVLLNKLVDILGADTLGNSAKVDITSPNPAGILPAGKIEFRASYTLAVPAHSTKARTFLVDLLVYDGRVLLAYALACHRISKLSLSDELPVEVSLGSGKYQVYACARIHNPGSSGPGPTNLDCTILDVSSQSFTVK